MHPSACDDLCTSLIPPCPSHTFEQQLAAGLAPPPLAVTCGVLLAVSGGADSVALARALGRLAAPQPDLLAVAHFNHGLRGAASDDDQQFVDRAWPSRWACRCYVGQAESLAAAASAATASKQPPARPATVPDRDGRATRRSLRRHRPHGRRPGRNHAASRRARHRARRAGRHAARARAQPGRDTGAPAAGRARRRSARVSGRARADRFARMRRTPIRTFMRNRIRHELLPLLARDYSPAMVDSLLRLGTLAGDASSDRGNWPRRCSTRRP